MAAETKDDAISLRKFLESVPPGTNSNVSDLSSDWEYGNVGYLTAPLALPEITLHCDTAMTCGGNRLFRTSQSILLYGTAQQLEFVTYTCKNCSKSLKIFAILVKTTIYEKDGTA